MLGMDKLAFAATSRHLGIPCLPRVNVAADMPAPDFPAPFIVKPRLGGSSLGIQVADDLETAIQLSKSYLPLRNGAVLEPYMGNAVDINVAFRTSPTLEFSLLEKPVRDPQVEFYDFGAKYLRGGGLQAAPRELPANVSPPIAMAAKNYASTLIIHAGFVGVGRIDFLLDGDNLYLNEINTIPGAMSLYLWPQSVDFDELLLGMVAEAQYVPRWHTAGSSDEPGAALRIASGIAEKLMQNRGVQRG
jgi:D-alanine-D-alanine ligase